MLTIYIEKSTLQQETCPSHPLGPPRVSTTPCQDGLLSLGVGTGVALLDEHLLDEAH